MMMVPIHSEGGFVTIVVAAFTIVLFGFAALSFDVGRLYVERRGLARNADMAALSGAQLLWMGGSQPETEAKYWVGENPTTGHPGAYNPDGGDSVQAKYLSSSTGCTFDGQSYDCLEVKTVAPAWEYSFAKALGFDTRTIQASARALIGRASVGGTTVVPWILRDCPNAAEYPEESGLAVNGCPYYFTDSFVDDPTSPFITKFEESGLFVGASLAYESLGCPHPRGYKNVFHGNSIYTAMNVGDPTYTPCRISPGLRVNTRGGNLGAQLKDALEARGATTANCANATAFYTALGRTDDGDGFVSIKEKNPCLVQVAFGVYAAPASRVATVDDDVPGTPSEMQALISEPGGDNRFAGMVNNKRVVIRRMAWYYITGYTSGSQSAPIGVYLRGIDGTSEIDGALDSCPEGTSITECAHHGIFVVKLTV